MRSAVPADADELATFNASIHSDDGPDKPEESLGVWTRDLLTRPHPTFTAGLTTIVEDAENKKIVSTALLIPQTWTYEGVAFGVGRPELIATDPDYRNRGLVREQMNVLHQWSANLGHKMQAITGIPWFYRQFGYEMGLDQGGGRIAYEANIPQLKSDEVETFTFRPATAEDVPFLIRTYEQSVSKNLIACSRDTALWIYELDGKSTDNHNRWAIRVIERNAEAVGFAIHPNSLPGKLMSLYAAGLTSSVSWSEITPAILRYIHKTGKEFGEVEQRSYEGVYLSLGISHPIFELFPNYLPIERKPYAWYIRIPDLADFLGLITPVLDKRLAASAMHNYNGEVDLSFYRSGIKLIFKNGRLAAVKTWRPDSENGSDAFFPDLSFISLVCGRRSFKTLSDFFADCYAPKDEVAALLSILFPQKTSTVLGVE